MLPNCLNFSHAEIVCPSGCVWWTIREQRTVRRGGPQPATLASPHKDNPVDLSPPLSLFMSRLMTCLVQSVVRGVTITVGDMAPFTNFWPNLFFSTAVNKTWMLVGNPMQRLHSWDCLDWVFLPFTIWSYSVSCNQRYLYSDIPVWHKNQMCRYSCMKKSGHPWQLP